MDRFKTLTLNKEFKRLYYQGRKRNAYLLVTYAKPNRRRCCRIGITAGKKVGNAVVRNRIRRMIREAFRVLEKEMDLRGYDFVFVARSNAYGKKMNDVYREMKKQVDFLVKFYEKEGSLRNRKR